MRILTADAGSASHTDEPPALCQHYMMSEWSLKLKGGCYGQTPKEERGLLRLKLNETCMLD